MTKSEALYALRLGYKNMNRMTNVTKAARERRESNPDFTFRAKPIPGWVYYPDTDTVKEDAF